MQRIELPLSMIEVCEIAKRFDKSHIISKNLDLIQEVIDSLDQGSYILTDSIEIQTDLEYRFFLARYKVVKEIHEDRKPWFIRMFQRKVRMLNFFSFEPLGAEEVGMYDFCEQKAKAKRQGYKNTTCLRMRN